jgi:hypothetical protein
VKTSYKIEPSQDLKEIRKQLRKLDVVNEIISSCVKEMYNEIDEKYLGDIKELIEIGLSENMAHDMMKICNFNLQSAIVKALDTGLLTEQHILDYVDRKNNYVKEN